VGVIPIQSTPYCIHRQISLAKLTSFRVGGSAEFYIAPKSLDEMQAAIAWAEQESVPVTLIGAGSNLLISDRGLDGLVLCTRRLKHVDLDAESGVLTASAGESIVRLAWRAAEKGLSGLEWAVGIPGTVGGAVVMNAGAHQWCTADILVTADALDMAGNRHQFQPGDLEFDYRTSAFQQSDLLVTQASFQLRPGQSVKAVMQATRDHLKHRQETQPYHLPSCGSVFRNPSPHKAGWLIEQTGLKGYQIGGAQVAEQHANFILNMGNATASDIFSLIQHIQEKVSDQWTLLLRPEVKFIGEF
jgi:UDP-N-acetylmuramate dehydrogenase